MKPTHVYLFLAALAAFGASPVSAQITLVTDRAALPPTDSVEWSVLGAHGTILPNAFSVNTADGSVVQVSNGGGMVLYNQTTDWLGNFSPGDALLGTLNSAPVVFNPQELISGAGFNIQSNFFGAFTAQLDAFDSSSALLGSVTANGNSTSDANGSAVFIGFTSPTSNVDYFTASLSAAQARPNDFAINSLSLSDTGTTLQAAQLVAVPEPSTYGVLGALALVGAVAYRKRQARAVKS